MPSQKLYGNRLLDAMKVQVWTHITAYNKQFDEAGHSKAYPLRLKKTEINTLFNILRAYAAQLANEVNAGDPIRNVVLINNISAQAGDGHKSNTPRHLSKLCRAGFLAGYTSDCRQYRSVLDGGKGFGFCPIKKFRGTGRDFGLLINPIFIPLAALPAGVPVLLQDRFSTPEGVAPLPKCETFALSLDKKNYINESMKVEAAPLPQKVFASANDLLEEQERQPQEDRKVEAARPNDFSEASTKISRRDPAPSEMEVPAGNIEFGDEILKDAPKGRLFRELFQEGKELTAFAVMLVQMYLNKLAPAMKQPSGESRIYFPSSIASGVKKAEILLSQYQDLNQGFDQLTSVIDRMQARIERDPYTSYVAPPCQWFDSQYPYNIHFHREKYLKPYLARKQDFQTGKAFTAPPLLLDDISITEKSKYHALAWSMKKYMCERHPTDRRLRQADLNKWAATLRLMTSRDRIPYQNMVHVAKWMLLSNDPDALFWGEAGGFGIRSATGFRRNFRQIQHQYAKVKARENRKAG